MIAILLTLLQMSWMSHAMDSCPLRHKIGQMIITNVETKNPQELRKFKKFAQENNLGGVIMYGWVVDETLPSANDVIELVNYLQKDMPTPLFIAVDQEGGLVQRLNASRGFTQIPKAERLGDIKDPERAYELGKVIGSELAAVGVNLNLAPDLDVLSHPDNQVIGESGRAISDDPRLVAGLGSEVIRGIQDQNVVSIVKHFPGHGATAGDTHDSMQVIPRSWKEIARNDLVPFLEAMNNNVGGIMMGHLGIPEVCGKEPASLSHNLITNMIRKKYGYSGLIMTDDLSMGGARETTESFEELIDKAVIAGNDILLTRNGGERKIVEHLCRATQGSSKKSRLLRKRIENSSRRIAATKKRFGITNFKPIPPLTKPISTEEHQRITQEIFDLSNEARGKPTKPLLKPEDATRAPTWRAPDTSLIVTNP